MNPIRFLRGCITKSSVRRMLALQSLEDYSMQERRAMWPPAMALSHKHVQNCRLVADRDFLLGSMPKGSTVAEAGILRCDFSEKIYRHTKPSQLHLIDIEEDPVALARQRFGSEIAAGRVVVHQGDSSTVISAMPDDFFDWIYIDADHSYAGVKKDLEAACQKVKKAGLIALNDYIFLSPSDMAKYGVVEAVNEFCITHDYEMIFMTLHPRLYNDVVLRRMSC